MAFSWHSNRNIAPGIISDNDKPASKEAEQGKAVSGFGDIVKKDVEDALGLLTSEQIVRNFDNGTVYEIRYNEGRLRESPFAVEILKAYAALLKVRCINEGNK